MGIQLAASQESEIFKWFLASFLYGARISGVIASRTYREFEKRGVITPQKIQDTGWDGLVEILDAGGYVRYDFSTATKLLAVSADLITHYGGRLSNIHAASADARDLEKRLQSIGKGIGPVTANIFLRELRGIWQKTEPLPSELVALAVKHLGLVSSSVKRGKRMLELLKEKWKRAEVREFSFADFEAALVRLGRDYCRKKMHAECPMAQWCPAGGFTGRSK
jgi:endonuclease III